MGGRSIADDATSFSIPILYDPSCVMLSIIPPITSLLPHGIIYITVYIVVLSKQELAGEALKRRYRSCCTLRRAPASDSKGVPWLMHSQDNDARVSPCRVKISDTTGTDFMIE